ncbi:DNA-packaging protein, partial [Klebsiella pneumoniae]|nr:DNA-packaging protein [Klebsiella pneumoniae]
MTLSGLFLFLDIDRKTWEAYAKNKDLLPITTRVEDLIYEQKFSGAAADLLNANIIARELGLVEKKSVE